MLTHIQQLGGGFAVITPVSAVDPGFGVPGGPRPDHGLPPSWPGHVSPPIYHPGHPDHGLPAHPDQGLPGGHPGAPDNTLPSPPTVLPGWTLVLVRRADGKWQYATLAPSSPPPKPVPEPIPPGGAPDQGLPVQPPTPTPTAR